MTTTRPRPTRAPQAPVGPVTPSHGRPPRRATWFRWGMLLKPFQPRKEGTMPAGMVLIVVVVGLAAAALLNADAILRKSNAKGEVDGWRNELAHTFASVSDTLRFTALRSGVDSALGKNQSSDIDVEDLLAQQLAEQSEPEVDPATLAAEEAARVEAERIAALTPKLPAATPTAPLPMYIGGDSIAREFGQAMQQVALDTGVFTPTLDYRPATGLSRPDFFNWPEHLVRDVVPTDPAIVVLQFGANDAQGFTIDGKAVERFSPEWLAEYRRRVAATMDLMRSPENDRLVVWVGAPIMGPGTGVTGMDQLNYIYWDEARTRPWVQYFDTWPFLADANLQYVDEAPAADGSSTDLRQSDRVHLSAEGGTRVAWGVVGRIGESVDITAGNVVPPPGDAAPPGVVARTELPPPA